MSGNLPVKRGLSANTVRHIPQQWDPNWFRRFITDHMQNADTRNAIPGPGISITDPTTGLPPTGKNPAQFSVAGVFAAIPNKTVLGNVSGAVAPPSALTQVQLTALISLASLGTSGAAPALTGVSTQFLNGTGAYSTPIGVASANPSALVGLTPVNGVATTYLRSDGAPALNTGIAPTWTAAHTFHPGTATTAIIIQPVVGQFGIEIDDPGTNNQQLALGTSNTETYIKTTGTGTQLSVYTSGTRRAQIIAGMLLGAPTGGDQGAGTLNATGLFVNGVAVGGSISPANPTASVGLTAVNGTATTYMRSDAAPPISQAIAPTWTAVHTFHPSAATTAIIIQPFAGQFGLEIDDPGANSQQLALGTSNTESFIKTTGTGNQLSLYTSAILRAVINSAGNVTVNAPTSGVGLTVNGATGAQAMLVSAGAGQQAIVATAGADLAGILINGAQNNVSLTLNNTAAGATANWRISSSATGSGFGAGNLAIGTASTQYANFLGTTGELHLLNTIGSTYGGQFVLINSSVGATNTAKYFRINPTGGLELINSAYSANLFSISDAGAVNIAGTLTGAAATFSGLVTQNSVGGSGGGYNVNAPAATQINALQMAQTGQTTWVIYEPASNSDFRIFGGADRLIITNAGAVQIPTSPLSATVTQAMTGLAAFKPTATTSANNTLTSDAALTITFNETGWYEVEIWLPVFEATSGAGGFQFNFLNGGTAGFANVTWTALAFGTALVARSALTSPATVISAATVSTASASPSWFLAKGQIQVTSTGTAAVQWAQLATLGADPTTLMAGAYVKATKQG